MLTLLLFIGGVTLSNLMGHSSGVRNGYSRGYKDADDWWIKAESEIEAEYPEDEDRVA